ncbi:retrotransposon-related protein [Tanacetum coccineum]
MIGNGDHLHSKGVCLDIPLRIQDYFAKVDLYLLPIKGAELVLGVQWLLIVGPHWVDYSNLTLGFFMAGRYLMIHGNKLGTTESHHSHLNSILNHTIDEFLLVQKRMNQHTAAMLQLQPNPTYSLQDLSADLPNILTSFMSLFCSLPQLPPHRDTDHRIHLIPSTNPINVRPYRYPHYQKDVIEKMVSEMLTTGIIEPSTSPFSSPVLLVRKKTGDWHFYVDYRALNEVTVKDRFPILTIDELIDELHGATIFTKLDLRSGHHQIRMSPVDVYKTAFRTHHGHYQFIVMPFGLTNAPATFQATMNQIFKPYLRKFVTVFFDDILIYSKSPAEHSKHLHIALASLQDNQFVINEKKCSFIKECIQYLGHIVSYDGVCMEPEKIQAILEWPLPTNAKGVRGFLGLSGYYRKFIRGYAMIASPLTDLLRKDAFRWSLEAEQAFRAL